MEMLDSHFNLQLEWKPSESNQLMQTRVWIKPLSTARYMPRKVVLMDPYIHYSIVGNMSKIPHQYRLNQPLGFQVATKGKTKKELQHFNGSPLYSCIILSAQIYQKCWTNFNIKSLMHIIVALQKNMKERLPIHGVSSARRVSNVPIMRQLPAPWFNEPSVYILSYEIL